MRVLLGKAVGRQTKYLQGLADGSFEIVDFLKIGEEGQQILDAKQRTVLQQLLRLGHIIALVDFGLSCKKRILVTGYRWSGALNE